MDLALDPIPVRLPACDPCRLVAGPHQPVSLAACLLRPNCNFRDTPGSAPGNAPGGAPSRRTATHACPGDSVCCPSRAHLRSAAIHYRAALPGPVL